MQPAVVFDHVWKKFLRGERHDSLRDLLPAMAKSLLRRRRPDELENDQEFWAVKDVSFEVKPGEALGIIGPNGAGKSTTLKLLTKILRPTRGHCHVRGRVGALIEVAAGFHPDLTGRENIFLQGAIMGMRRLEISTKLEEIIEFAGVAAFIDTPVKRYSSGMNARLGFSIAAHLNPDVLIIDEVLGVGDAAFQRKCVERMRAFKTQGVSIVFVSHNLQAVSELCDMALFIKTSTQAFGSTDDTIMTYVAGSQNPAQESADDVAISCGPLESRKKDAHGVSEVEPGEHLTLRVTYRSRVDVSTIELAFVVYRSTDELLVYSLGLPGESLGLHALKAGQPVEAQFNLIANLTRGHYFIECHMYHRPTQRYLGRLKPAALFHVGEDQTWGGVADLAVRCTVAARDGGERAQSAMVTP